MPFGMTQTTILVLTTHHTYINHAFSINSHEKNARRERGWDDIGTCSGMVVRCEISIQLKLKIKMRRNKIAEIKGGFFLFFFR